MKKGFTLIELLAVILILGIISLIAIPVVNSTINESKKNAFETTSNNIVNIIENKCELQMLKGEEVTSLYEFNLGVISPGIDIKGTLPTSGYATVDSNCKVSLAVSNNNYTAVKSISSNSVSTLKGNDVYDVYPNGTAVYFNPETGLTCNVEEAVSTTGTKSGCMKWYTFNDEGSSSEFINLILDHATTAVVAWNSTGININGPTDIMLQLKIDTSGWVGVSTRIDSYNVDNETSNYTINYDSYKARLIKASEVAKITGNTSFIEETAKSTSYFYFDSNNQTQTINTIGASDYDWLFDYTNGCTDFGCNISDASNYGYWTATAVSTSTYDAWFINSIP